MAELTKTEIKEQLLKALEAFDDPVDGEPGDGTDSPTPYQKCVASHVGQCGACDSDGAWTGC